MKRGFTVLELLVASLLLSMLVTMLTMIFNQSSIAWRTGVSSVSKLGETRMQIGGVHDIFDDTLPGVGQNNATGPGSSDNRQLQFRTVSIFKNWSGNSRTLNSDFKSAQQGNCSGRLLDSVQNQASLVNLSLKNSIDSSILQGRTMTTLSQGSRQSNRGYIVGVRSAGPDGQMETEDDIDTFPENVQ